MPVLVDELTIHTYPQPILPIREVCCELVLQVRTEVQRPEVEANPSASFGVTQVIHQDRPREVLTTSVMTKDVIPRLLI